MVGAAVHLGCASVCREMATDRQAFFSRQGTTTEPHATVFVPFALANRLIAKRLADLHPVGAPISLPGNAGKVLGAMRLVPRRVTLQPAPPDRLGLRMELDVLSGNETLFSMMFEVGARPELFPDGGRLEVGLRADDVTAIRPHLGAGATERLATAIRARLPSVARSMLPQQDVEALARSGTDFLGGQLGAVLLRSGLLSPLGEIARLGVSIPVVPIARFDLRSFSGSAGGITVGVYTTLPVHVGLPVAIAEDRGGDETIRVHITGDALAELGNWALGRGLLPNRYDGTTPARGGGEFTPGLRWVEGGRPLKVYAWRIREPCLRVRVGAEPRLALSGGRLVVGIDSGTVEEVRGSLLVEVAVWLKEIGADAIRFSHQTISSARVSIAGTPVEATIARASIEAGVFGLDLHAR
jgi:hypothetical protein